MTVDDIDGEIAELTAHIDALLEKLREHQRARGVAEDKLPTRKQIEDIMQRLFDNDH